MSNTPRATIDSILSHENKKALSPFIIKIFFIENECKIPGMTYNHFVSKIFFYEKMGFRLFNFRVKLLERIEKIIKEEI